jgi:hypothetical protein
VTAGAVAVALSKARAFVDAHGDPLQRARAAAVLDPAARDAVTAELPPVDTPVAAYLALGWLDALSARRGPTVERAVATLSGVQYADGSWILGDERDEAAEIATTASIAGLLAKAAYTRKRVLDAAGAWLGARWGPERVQGGDVRLIAGFASFFANTDHELSDAGLQWCGRELERGFRTGALDALAVARVFVRCDAQGLPGGRIGAEEIVLSLLAQQSDAGAFGDAEATVDAMCALRRLGR